MLAGTASYDKADRPDRRLNYALGNARLDLKATGALSEQEIALPITNSRCFSPPDFGLNSHSNDEPHHNPALGVIK